ncbi:MAG TPA: hypothetical protein VGZ29_04045 [Terriglobia bacterium]|nr:hypothetical protein [Terriglobia bacterium]
MLNFPGLRRLSLIHTGLIFGMAGGVAIAVAQSQPPAPVVQVPPPESTAKSAAAPVPAAASAADATAGKLTIPRNTTIALELRNTINSRTAQPGQAVYCTTIYPVVVNNRIVIPVGSYARGKLTEVKRPGRVKGKAELALVFTEITLPNGVTKSLRSPNLTGYGDSSNQGFSSKEGKIQGESTKGKDAETVAVSGAEGAGIGAVAGISGRHTGLGAGVGGVAGALGGLVYVLASRGKDVVVPAGTNLEISLGFPLTFDEDELQSPSSGSPGPDLGRRDPGPGI